MLIGSNIYLANVLNYVWMYRLIILSLYPYLIIIIIIIIKQKLTSAPVLVHYDLKLPIVLASDASAYSIGAVISHSFPDGSEKPIAYSSRTLSSAEKNYAQVEKEALALIIWTE